MDYHAWTERVQRFINRFQAQHPDMDAEASFGPSATEEQVVEVEQAIGRALPAQYRNFLLTASGDCEFGYRWEPSSEAETQRLVGELGSYRVCGGLESFATWQYLARDYQTLRESAEEGRYGDEPFCQDPLEIGSMGNGNHIAINLASGAVVFLGHDRSSSILAPDFDSFLDRWEAVYYLDFDMGPHERFIQHDGRGLDPTANAPALLQLRERLLPGD